MLSLSGLGPCPAGQGVKALDQLSVPVPVPRRSAPAVMPEAEVEHMKDVGGAVLDGASEWAGLENAVLGSEWLEVKQQ